MPHLHLGADELLTTTRAVRKRLDLRRPVEREVIAECAALAQQAPNGGNAQMAHFVAVTDPAQRAVLAAVWNRGHREFNPDPGRARALYGERVWGSLEHLAAHLHEVPVHLVPCRAIGVPRAELGHFHWANVFADAHMATWSFMLAARERGLGTCLTTLHLQFEREAAEVLGIPFEAVVQTALVPLAHTIGTDFKPGPRRPVEAVLHWDRW